MSQLTKEAAWDVFKGGAETQAKLDVAPKFAVGDRVRCLNINPQGHTRLPQYLRGKVGTVMVLHGGYVFADSRGRDLGDDPQHVYGVRFTGPDIWGPEGHPKDSVQIDMWESYIVAEEEA